MRVKTHQYIAETAIELIENITGIQFNHRLLKIGACAPDLALNRRVKLHSPELVGVEYEKIINKFQNANRSTAFLSYMLGVFSHYIADAFCFAHNYYVIDLKSHVQYEVLLQEIKDSIPLPLDLVDTALDGIDELKHSTVLDYIQSANNEYKNLVKEKSDWAEISKIDLSFAVSHCVTLMLQLVYEVQAQQILAPAV